ncbi:sulfite exporter TauE/SafE family protein [Actinoplanes sp. NPDC049316]|uniref:sulfite exporter TauE/SafE family protein n=1 Tax=Actinoplanes sp. NPDC049316 TaxID=3154727 RepID=UPI00341EC1C0
MTLFAAAGLGLVIGVILGGLGGGGAILTVPALVYLLGQSPQNATTSSLIIVGATAVVGAAGHGRAGNVRWRTGLTFGVTGIAAAVAGSLANRHVAPRVLLLGFAALMVVTAAGMLVQGRRGSRGDPPDAAGSPLGGGPGGSVGLARVVPGTRTRATVKLVAAGLAVGFLTGFLGVGGGFVIVPALVLVLGLPMSEAVGTSLVIIAINSLASLVARTGYDHVDWATTVPFALAAMAASLAGRKAADRVPETVATRAFAVLILLVAAYTAVHTLTGP